jgi:hypothetical protein
MGARQLQHRRCDVDATDTMASFGEEERHNPRAGPYIENSQWPVPRNEPPDDAQPVLALVFAHQTMARVFVVGGRCRIPGVADRGEEVVGHAAIMLQSCPVRCAGLRHAKPLVGEAL